jgi:hypothetical protein
MKTGSSFLFSPPPMLGGAAGGGLVTLPPKSGGWLVSTQNMADGRRQRASKPNELGGAA